MQHGEWLPMLQEVGIDQSTARRLMSIGGNPAIANRGNCHDFPAALRSLYELSRLAPEAIESGIEHGDLQGTLARLVWHYGPYAQEFSETAQACFRSGPRLTAEGWR